MTDMTFDYTEAQRELDRVGLLADDKSRARVAKVQAQATVDIAISLSIIAEALTAQEQRKWVEKRENEQPIDKSDTGIHSPSSVFSGQADGGFPTQEQVDAMPDVAPALDAEPGDTVRLESDEGSISREVLEVGSTEGEVWLKLAGVKGKKWARDYVIVERGVGGDFA